MRRNYLALMLLAMASLAVGPIAVLAGGQGGVAGVTPAGTVFTYQGRLLDGGVPVNSTCDFEFSLWDAAIGPSQIGLTLSVNSVTITDGLFTVPLDFGAAAFNGNARWLQIAVRCPAGAGVFTTLTPRQPLTAAPYALRALGPWAISPINKSDIFYDAGNVGIGTTAPEAKLDVISTSDIGVSGDATATTGFTRGVEGRNSSTSGGGVFGEATALTGSTSGVQGDAHSTGGTGVLGRALAPSGDTTGVVGEAASPDGTGVVGTGGKVGVFGDATTTGISTFGVIGRASGTVGTGVAGDATDDTTGFTRGVSGTALSTNGTGVFGCATATTGDTRGMTGEVFSGNGVAGMFISNAAGGTALRCLGPGGVDVFAVAGDGFVRIDGDASVGGNLSVSGTLSKGAGMFRIDHPLDPLNKYLYHSFIESPDMMNVYNGNVTTDGNSNAVVTLPAYFEALNRDFRYQLTVIGQFAQAIVAEEIQSNRFVIRTDKPNVKVSWQVTGIRQDPYAQANRVPVEQEKPEAQRGVYLHPEAYGVAGPISPTARATMPASGDVLIARQ